MNARPLPVYSREDLLRVKMGRAGRQGAKDGQDKPVDNNGTLTKKTYHRTAPRSRYLIKKNNKLRCNSSCIIISAKNFH